MPRRSWPAAVLGIVLATLLVTRPAPADAQGVGTWTQRHTLNTMRTEVGGAVVNGRLHVIGGYPGGTGGPGAHEAYDPTTNTWTTLAPVPSDLNHAGAVELHGKLYVLGGWGPTGLPLSALFRYDAGPNAWTMLEPMPTARGALAVFAYQDHIFAIGGYGAGGDTGVVEIYDPVTNAWVGDHEPMPTPRNHVMYGELGGLLHVVGGRIPINGILTNHDAYNPATNTWISLAPLPTGRSGGAATVYKGRLHVVGGEGRNGPTFEEHEAYDPGSNSWVTLAPLPTPRHGLAVGTVGDLLYAASGGPSPGATYSNLLEAFSIALSCNPRPRVTVQTAALGSGRLQGQISATTNPGTPPNRLASLEITKIVNAGVDVRTFVDQRQPFTVPLPDRPAGVTVVLQRINPGPFTVSLVAHDDCGAWPTFVGGGGGVS